MPLGGRPRGNYRGVWVYEILRGRSLGQRGVLKIDLKIQCTSQTHVELYVMNNIADCRVLYVLKIFSYTH
jgi:hypothetical protein